jgi:hypothetical protein
MAHTSVSVFCLLLVAIVSPAGALQSDIIRLKSDVNVGHAPLAPPEYSPNQQVFLESHHATSDNALKEKRVKRPAGTSCWTGTLPAGHSYITNSAGPGLVPAGALCTGIWRGSKYVVCDASDGRFNGQGWCGVEGASGYSSSSLPSQGGWWGPCAHCGPEQKGAEIACAEPIELDLSKPVHSNLGGKGPDTGPQNIKYKDVTFVGPDAVDLVITALDDYDTDKSSQNGLTTSGNMARISQKSGTSTVLEFSFEDQVTKKPVEVGQFSITFYDIDGYPAGDLKESVTICGAKDICVSENTGLMQTAASSASCTTISPKLLDGKSNPSDPKVLTDVQRSHAVSAVFSQTSSFTITSTITNGDKHRPIIFAGVGSICPAGKLDVNGCLE